MIMKRVNVKIWSDFVCPWCWIAKRRFEKAVAALENQVEVVVTHKAYRLARGMAPVDFKEALYAKFGNSSAAEGMMAAVAKAGVTEGLKYNFDTMRFGDTTAAHALVKSIESSADRQRMIEGIYRGVTTDGLNIFDANVLLALAKELGVTTSFDFESRELESEIARDENEASHVANGVPLFVFADKFFVSGVREVASFEATLLKAAADVEDSAVAAGATCSINGCTS